MSPISFVLLALCGLAFGTENQVAAGLDDRIVGGDPVTVEEYPYMLSLRKNGGHWCGAAIIGPYHALTAAHCVRVGEQDTVTMHAATSYRNVPGSVHQPKKITLHPKFVVEFDLDYDYAIVEIETPFPIGQSGVESIELCSVEPAGGLPAVVTGWGNLVEGGDVPNQLQAVHIQTHSREVCLKKYAGWHYTDRMICAGTDGKDACRGDSGGPLVVNGQVCGVVSWSARCGQAQYPHVYANVANQRAWIAEVTGL